MGDLGRAHFPLPLVGRGRGGGREDEILNHFQYAIDVAHHLIVPESQDTIAFQFQKTRALRVPPTFVSVLPAVDFDNDLQAMTRKIDNVATQMNLPAKM